MYGSFCYSRLMYSEIVFNQEVKTFIKCYENTFRYFGVVPKTVKIDNLKTAILEANFYEPVCQREYEELSKYYGFISIPCRVRTPTDKAKIESGVKYVKNNFFKVKLLILILILSFAHKELYHRTTENYML
ncbi:MAG: hypothetical protein MJA82_18105 [Clostridia bacterium]|nr:hypothetical protein [Clostridia bacterium]